MGTFQPLFSGFLRIFRKLSINFNKLDGFLTSRHVSGAEAGYGMLVALFFVAFVASVTTVAIDFDRQRLERAQIKAAAWHLATVSKAARIYVRDNSFATPDADIDNDGVADDANNDGVVDDIFSWAELTADADNNIPISLNDLVTAGLLPPNFTLTNVWGQTTQVYAALYPIDPSPNQVPAAYVHLDTGPRGNPGRMAALATAVREFDGSFNAPIFDDTGANVTGDCNGDIEPDLANWVDEVGNTQCLDQSDMNTFGLAAFQPGELLVPTWRMAVHDTRAMMRFSQPGLTSSTTMQTDLKFGTERTDAAGNCIDPLFVYYPNSTGGGTFTDSAGNNYNEIDSTLCKVEPEQALGVAPYTAQNVVARDLRVDVRNIGNIDAAEIILSDQQLEHPGILVQETSYDYASATEDQTADLQSLDGAVTNEVMTLWARPANGTDPGATGELRIRANMELTGRLDNPTVGGAYEPRLSFRSVNPNTSGSAARFENGIALRDLNVDHNVFVQNLGPATLSMTVNNNASLNDALIAQDGIVTNMNVDTSNPANFLGSNNTTINNLIVDPTATNFNEGVLTSRFDATNMPSLNLNSVDVSNNLNANGITVTGTTPIAGYTMIAGQIISTGTLNVGGDVNVANQINALSDVTISNGTSVNFCSADGRCPDISEDPPACAALGTC